MSTYMLHIGPTCMSTYMLHVHSTCMSTYMQCMFTHVLLVALAVLYLCPSSTSFVHVVR